MRHLPHLRPPFAARPSLLAAGIAALTAAPALADVVLLTETIVPANPAADDRFGAAVDVSGTTLISGAPRDPWSGGPGAAFLHDLETGAEIAALSASDGAEGDGFGIAVAIEGPLAVVGAYLHDANGADSGAVYVFDAATGTELRKLLPDDGGVGDFFGISVAIAGTTVVVGASGDDDNAHDAGAAYVFDAATGTQLAKLLAIDGASDDHFGSSVATDGVTAMVGAPDDGGPTAQRGSAYLFDVASGTQLRKLLSNGAGLQDRFGWSVAVDGPLALAGAWGNDAEFTDSGSAYVFDVATGAQLQRLRPSESRFRVDRFGNAVALQGSTALVGAHLGWQPEYESGNAYVFDAGTGVQLTKLASRAGARNELMGFSVAIDGATAVLGAYGAEPNGESLAGSVYAFEPFPAAAFRNAGTNPDSFRASAPWLGDALEFTVDLSTTGHTHAYVFGFDSPVQLTLGGGQTLLCLDLLGFGPVIDSGGFVEGPLAYFNLPFPGSTLGLVGFEACAQALHAFGTAPFALSNAQDLVVGGCEVIPEWRGLLAPDSGAAYGRFGSALAVEGGTALIGAYYDDGAAENTGRAYLFDVATGAELLDLSAKNGAAEDYFGLAVALADGTALVGAYNADRVASGSGAAYLFDAATGAELFELSPSDGGENGNFGRSVAIDDGFAVVGAHPYTGGTGSTFVFDVVTGLELGKLVPAGGEPDSFGFVVAMHGTTAYVGAPTADGNAPGSGAVYLFDVTTLQPMGTLLPAGGDTTSSFGARVVTDGALVAVLASGKVFVFDAGTGAQVLTLDGIGLSSSLTLAYGVIGIGTSSAMESGAVDRFDATTGAHLGRILLGDVCRGLEDEAFGISVALSGTTLLAGALYAENLGVPTGGVYRFEF